MNWMERCEKEKNDFDQHIEQVDQQFNDFRAAAQEQFNRRANEKTVRCSTTIAQSPWFEALQNGKI